MNSALSLEIQANSNMVTHKPSRSCPGSSLPSQVTSVPHSQWPWPSTCATHFGWFLQQMLLSHASHSVSHVIHTYTSPYFVLSGQPLCQVAFPIPTTWGNGCSCLVCSYISVLPHSLSDTQLSTHAETLWVPLRGSAFLWYSSSCLDIIQSPMLQRDNGVPEETCFIKIELWSRRWREKWKDSRLGCSGLTVTALAFLWGFQ